MQIDANKIIQNWITLFGWAKKRSNSIAFQIIVISSQKKWAIIGPMTHNTLIIHPKSPTLALHISRTTDRIGKFESANEIATSQSVERNYKTNKLASDRSSPATFKSGPYQDPAFLTVFFDSIKKNRLFWNRRFLFDWKTFGKM